MSFVDMLLVSFTDVDIVSVLFADMTLLVLLVNVSLLLAPTDSTLVVSLVVVGIALLVSLVGVVFVVAMIDVMLRVGVSSSDCFCRSVMLCL